MSDDSESKGDSLGFTPAKYKRVMKKMNSVKLKHRSSLQLSDWERYGFHGTFDRLIAPLVRQAEIARRLAERGQRAKDQVFSAVERVHVRDFNGARDFVDRFERPYLPCVISGLADDWPALRHWTLEGLRAGPFRECVYKAGEDDDGRSCRVKLKTFLRYMRYNRDDSPLYVFDSGFDDKKVSRQMLHQYTVPDIFSDDLFRLVGEKRRPPYRWFLIGPKRSGSGIHIDPLATSAWNTLLSGRKLWILFRPGTPRSVFKGRSLKRKGEDGEAITYFVRVLPRLIERMRAAEREGSPERTGMVMFIQHPGETVFVPGGWHHGVLNLDDTIAVTQNFASRTNFPRVWRQTRKSRKHMARRLLDRLKTEYPLLHEQANRIDATDGFTPKFTSPEERLARKRKKREAMARKKHGPNAVVSESDDTSDSSTTSASSSSSSSSGSECDVPADPMGFERLRALDVPFDELSMD